MNPGAPVQSIPEKVFVKLRAIVTAGFANDVEDVHQYAAIIKRDTAEGVVSTFFFPESAITINNPNVATTSETRNLNSLRSWVDS